MYALEIRLGNGYSIYIGSGLLDDKSMYEHISSISKICIIISDSNVSKLYADKLLVNLSKFGVITDLMVFPAGEKYKSRTQKSKIEDAMLMREYGRDICILALGGGVTTDMAGFIAATYNRGVPIVYCPTSLLAMVDACIGGKTAVNTKYGKNLIGAFYQPESIYIDATTLKSLPLRQLQLALVEVIVHALIADVDLFYLLENELDDILTINTFIIDKLININCLIKKRIVELDEKDNGIRKILNFGHTIGHAIETCSNYKIAHGEAVAMGVMVEAFMAVEMGMFCREEFERVVALLKRLNLLTMQLGAISKKRIFKMMRLDKKSILGKPRFVILERIGKPLIKDQQVVFEIPDEIVKLGLDYLTSIKTRISCGSLSRIQILLDKSNG